jgi:hypothetical protein
MQVHFHRTDGRGGYAVMMRRDDGLTVRLSGDSHSGRIPHDLAHFVAEREFRFGHGVFGSIAAGAMFTNMMVVDGPPRHDEKIRSRVVIRAYAAELGLAEVVSGVIHDGVERHADLERVYRQLLAVWGSLRSAPCPYQVATLRRCLGLLDALEDRWRTTEVGHRLALRWELPGAMAGSTQPRTAGSRSPFTGIPTLH